MMMSRSLSLPVLALASLHRASSFQLRGSGPTLAVPPLSSPWGGRCALFLQAGGSNDAFVKAAAAKAAAAARRAAAVATEAKAAAKARRDAWAEESEAAARARSESRALAQARRAGR